MFNKIFFTFSTRFLAAILNFLIVVITAKYLGAENRGIISLIVLGITINLMVNNLIGGSALVYLVPRGSVFKLFVPSYIWAIVSSFVLTLVLRYFKLIPLDFSAHIFFLSLLQSLGSVNLTIFLGQEKIKLYNSISLLQTLLLFFSILGMFFILSNKSVSAYVYSLYIAFGFSFVASLTFILKELEITTLSDFKKTISDILKQSFFIQLANVIQILNYRLSYFILASQAGASVLGVYSTGVSVAESVWLIGKSIAMVQYARIANSNDINYSRALTIKLSKLSFLFTLAVVVPLVFLPSQFFRFVFGNEFGAIREVLIYLSVGVVSIGVSTIYVHYFSGIGKNYINTIASSAGFLLTLLFCLLLIPKYGLIGAAAGTSLSYLVTSVYLFIMFIKETGLKYSMLLLSREDFTSFKGELKELIKTYRRTS